MAVGTIAPLGYGVESTPGTAVAASSWVPNLETNGDTDLDLQFPEYITNTRQVNRFSLLGQQKTRGMAKFTLFPADGLALIIGALTTPTSTGTFVPTTGILPSFTLQMQKGAIQTFNLTGAQVDKLKISAKAGQQVEVNLDFFGLNYVAGVTPGTPSYGTLDPYHFANTLVRLNDYGGGGTTDTDITDVEFTLDNHLIEQWTLQAATAAPKRLDASKTTITGKVTKYFADAALFTAYRAKTYQAMQLVWTSTGTITMTIPRLAMKSHKQPVKLGQFIVQEFDFTGVYDTVVGGIFQIIVA